MSDPLPAKQTPEATRLLIGDFAFKFAEIRRESEQAITQLDAVAIRRSLDGDVNSVAVIMKHVGGNLRSRFTSFLTEDGEKPWRDREAEFVDDFPAGEAGRDAALADWRDGWRVLESTLASLCEADLATDLATKPVSIRGVPHTVSRALARSLAHMAYHQGQITLIARMIVGRERWNTISIPRGATAQRHTEMGFDPNSRP